MTLNKRIRKANREAHAERQTMLGPNGLFGMVVQGNTWAMLCYNKLLEIKDWAIENGYPINEEWSEEIETHFKLVFEEWPQ